MAKAVQFSFQRVEKKYLLTPAQYERLRQQLAAYMQEDEYGKTAICNIYYDTEDWELIRRSLEKPIYKEKLRVRSYGIPAEDGTVFVELKKKYDGIVYKRRIHTEAYRVEPFLGGLEPPETYGQIGREIGWFQRQYRTAPRVFIAYDRIALAGIGDPSLRVTFDTRLRWRDTALDLCLGDAGSPILPGDDRILMELKLPGVCPLWLSWMLTGLQLYPTSFSKYGTCFARYLNPNFIKEAHYCA